MAELNDTNDPFNPEKGPEPIPPSPPTSLPCNDFDDGFGGEVTVTNDEVKFAGMIEAIRKLKIVIAAKVLEVKGIIDVITPMIGRMGTADLLFLYKTIDDLHDVGEALKSSKEKQGKFIGRRLNDVLTSGKIGAINYDGYKFTPVIKAHYSVLSADYADFIAEMKKKEETAALVKETIHPNTLGAYCKNVVENGGVLPKHVNVYEEPAVNMRKIPSKNK